MQVKENDVNKLYYTPDELHEMEEKRITMLNSAGINEEEVLDQTNKDMNAWGSYFNENITRGKDDANFIYRDQWSAIERSEFTRLFKTAMTFNVLYDSIKKMTGEQRKNKPDLIVRSLTGNASQEEINLRADILRSIAYHSENDLIYQTAFRSASTMSYGAFQVKFGYRSPLSMVKDIYYDIITDSTMCSWDPTATKPHKGDGNFCQRRYVLDRDQFFATYPYVQNPVSYTDPYILLDFQIAKKDAIVICETFRKSWFPLVIYKLDNGMTVTDEEWQKAQETFNKQREIVKGSIVERIIEKGLPKIIDQRKTQDYKLMHYFCLRDRIIDFEEWPGKQLPIPFVDGDSSYIEGRQYTKSMVHEARDAQKLVNFVLSELATEIKNRRKEQWLATPDNIIGEEQQWRNPELQTGALMARPDPKTGMMPQKLPAWEISPGLFNLLGAAKEMLYQVLGMTESQLMLGKDISGKARKERKIEASMSSYVNFDNLNQSIEQGGRIVNELLPYMFIENEPRSYNVTRRNGKNETMVINQKQGESIVNVLTNGEFEVEIDTGPSFAVQKEVALEFLQQTLQTYPQGFPLVADLWAKNLDVQFMPQIADRFKTLVPPQIIAKEEGKELPPQPPSPQEQMMQMQMQLAQQQMQDKQSQLVERAHELSIRREKHELEKAKLVLDAMKLQDEMKMQKEKHGLEQEKSDMQFSTHIAKILTEHHKNQNKHHDDRSS